MKTVLGFVICALEPTKELHFAILGFKMRKVTERRKRLQIEVDCDGSVSISSGAAEIPKRTSSSEVQPEVLAQTLYNLLALVPEDMLENKQNLKDCFLS